MVKKPKPFLYKVIAGPEDFTPSSLETKIIGAFNPGVTTITRNGQEKTLLMIRVAETAKEEPNNAALLPYFPVENKKDSKFKVELEKVEKERGIKIDKKDVKLKDGLVRLKHISYPVMALSTNGIDIDWKENKPSFYPCYEHEKFGIEDVRIVKIEDTYFFTYVTPHRIFGVSTPMTLTKDFKTFKRLPYKDTPRPIFTGVKDIVPFPEKVPSTHVKNALGEKRLEYASLIRYNAYAELSEPGVWVTYSPDLIHWGNDHRLILSKTKVSGTGPAPVKLEDMWFGVYHEIETKKNKAIYKGALFGLDLNNPWKLLYRTPAFIEPNEHGREPGYTPNTVYPMGLIIRDGIASIYSGEDDSYVSVRQYYLEDLVKYLKQFNRNL